MKMKSYLLWVFLFGFTIPIRAQNEINKNEKNIMSAEILKKIELEKFDNAIGMEMGLAVIALAKQRKKHIAVQVERLNHIIFLYVDDQLPADKHRWLQRKANTAKNFEESSLRVKQDLKHGNMTLSGTFALDDKEYLAKGGAIPIFVKNAGMVAIISVSGLHDEEDHNIILEALHDRFLRQKK